MKGSFVVLATVAAALFAIASGASAQDTPAGLVDRISEIAGDNGFESDDQRRYFNRIHCGLDDSTGGGAGGAGGAGAAGGDAGTGGVGGMGGGSSAALFARKSPETTDFEIRLDNTGGSVREVFLWVGAEGSQCNTLNNRNETQGICAEIPGNPRVVGQDFLLSGLFLQDLLDARAGANQIVTCESSGLTGTPYEIFAFRDQAFSGQDVPPEQYGVTQFRVDVTPPAAPNVNPSPQFQTVFQISWSNPDPPDLIQLWNFYSSDSADASTATPLGVTAPLNELSQSISAETLGLTEEGDTAYVFMTAIDQAFISDALVQGNESELSEAVPVTFTAIEGACGGDCGGCSIAPMRVALANGAGLALLLGLGFVVARMRRLTR